MIQINEDHGVIKFANRRKATAVTNEIRKYFRNVSLSNCTASFTFERCQSESDEKAFTEEDVLNIVSMAIRDAAY